MGRRVLELHTRLVSAVAAERRGARGEEWGEKSSERKREEEDVEKGRRREKEGEVEFGSKR